MSFAFKRFNFLQHTEVPVHAYPINGTCCAPSPHHLYVGCDNGLVVVLDPNFQQLCSFQAHAFRVFHVAYLEERRLLLTLGSEEPGYITTCIKLWDLPNILATRATAGASIANFTPPQQHVKLVKVFSQKHPEAEITAVSALELMAPWGAGAATGPGVGGGGLGGGGTQHASSSALLGAGVGGAAGTSAGVVAGAGGEGVLAVAVGLATGLVYVLMVDLPGGPEASRPAGVVGRAVAGAPATAAKPISVTKLSARTEAGHVTVTGLALHNAQDTPGLFVVTESQTLHFNLKANTKAVLDAQGTLSPDCTALRGPKQLAQHMPRLALQAGSGSALAGDKPAGGGGGGALRAMPPLLMVARDEGLFNFAPDTRAGCTVLEGSKQRLVLLGRFVVVLMQEKTEVGASGVTVLIIDLPHKIISGSLTLSSATAVVAWACEPLGPAPAARGTGAVGAQAVGAAAGAVSGARGAGGVVGGTAGAAKPVLVVVTGGGKLYTFREVPLAMQLESLFKRSLHKLALDLARVQGADRSVITNIQQRWGDVLYSKGEYDAAMLQYCETIGFLEPSYVIRRFLDAQRIHNLTSYLELLHDRGIAGADHTTLLLNCYTKLKDVDKLDAFVQKSVAAITPDAMSTAGGDASSAALSAPHPLGPGPPSPRHRKAPSVAATAKAGEPNAGEGPGSRAAAAAAAAAAGDKKGGKKSGKKAAEEAGTRGPEGGESGSGRSAGGRRPELKFDAEIAVKVLRAAGYSRHALIVARAAVQPDWELDILTEDLSAWDEALTLMERLPRPACAAALRRVGKVLLANRPELTTRLIMDLCAPSHGAGGTGDGYSGSVADFAHLFCDAPTALMVLCEYILNTAPPGTITDERMLYHTLLELYLADTLEDGRSSNDRGMGADGSTPESVAAERQERRHKALALLQSGWPTHLEHPKYDQEHALVLCRLAGFKQGLVLLYDRLRLYREVMQVHMSSGDHASLLAAVLKYGDVSRGGDPHLWVLLLEYLAEQTTPDVEQRVAEVVEHVEASNILPPVMVLKLLSSNTHLQMQSLRGFVARQLSREVAEASRDREAASRLAADTANLRAELMRLKSQARVFQASRCSATGQPLELPAVHFLCGHAYNLRALGENDKECPLCAPDFKRVAEIRKNMAASALQQDRFFTELRESSDGFSVVAEHFGRGLMNMTASALNVDLLAGGVVGSALGLGGLAGLAAVMGGGTAGSGGSGGGGG